MMYPLIEINNVVKKIDNFTLGPINLTIEPGTITALVGDNGSGKSTILKMILNLIHPTKGAITAFGQQVKERNESWKEQIAYQPQTTIGYDSFNGRDLKELISHWYPTWNEQLFNKIVTDLSIPLNINFSKLSQGVQQKLILALTIARGTKIIILDEPMTFIDIPSKKYLLDLIVEWMEDGEGERSIILASHQVEDIKKLADYIYLLRGGEAIGLFEKDNLIESYKRYWIIDTKRLPLFAIPGEVERDEHSLLSNDMEKTESFLEEHQIEWKRSTSLELEEIIEINLQKSGKVRKSN